jgi:predicted transcriptional regulator
MSRVLNRLNTATVEPKESLKPITVRLPEDYLKNLDELAKALDITRQTLASDMLKDGIDQAMEVIRRKQK